MITHRRPRRPRDEAFYLVEHKTRRLINFESPSDFPLDVRTQALITAVTTTLDRFMPAS